MSTLEEIPKSCAAPQGSSRAVNRAIHIPELAEHIIDFLHDDQDALSRCSLVCRAWLPASSRHLFNRFSWPPCQHAFGVARPKNGCKCAFLGSGTNFWSTLADFLEGSHRVRTAVRTLTIAFKWIITHRTVPYAQLWTTEYNFVATPSHLANVVDSLPNLQCLSLYHPTFRQDTSPHAPPRCRERTLNKLVLEYPSTSAVDYVQTALLQDVLQVFSRIHTVQIPRMVPFSTDNYPTSAATPDLSPLTDVQSLRIDNSSSSALIQVIRVVSSAAVASSIAHLSVHDLRDPVPSESLPALLHSLPYLETLSLSGTHAPSLLARPHLLPHLRTLALAGIVAAEPKYACSTWHVLHALATGAPPSVSDLKLRFVLRGPSETTPATAIAALQACDWMLLDTVLKAYKYTSVTLEFVLDMRSLALTQFNASEVRQAVEEEAQASMSARARAAVRLHVRVD